MKLFLLRILLLGGLALVFPASASAADAPSPIAASAPTFATAPSAADVAWKTCQAAYRDSLVKSDKEAGPVFATAEAGLQKFIADYPNDARHWEAQLDFAYLGTLRLREHIAPTPNVDELNRLCLAVINDPAAPVSIRTAAAEEKAVLLSEQGAQLIARALEDYDRQIASFRAELVQKKVPADGTLSRLIFQQCDLHKLYDNTRNEQRFLEALTDDPNPNVANVAHIYQSESLQQAHCRFTPLDLNFTAVDGRSIDLSKMRGKVVLVQFWATWCGPCVAEMPTVQEVFNQYHARGFEVVGISLDQDRSKLLSYLKVHNIPWPQFFDGKDFDNRISQSFGIEAIPSLWLFNQKGRFVDEVFKYELAPKVEELLARKS